MLALALGGRTVRELAESMSLPEFERWKEFYRLQPFDDLHRYHRPAALVGAASSKGENFSPFVTMLAQPFAAVDATPLDETEFSDADKATIRGLGLQGMVK